MFYIDHIDTVNKLYAVADSDDGAIDLITEDEYKEYVKQGIKINNWNEAKTMITESMNRNCNYHLWRKLSRNCSNRELAEYLGKYSVYTISQKLNEFSLTLDLSYCCKIFDYSQTNGYYFIALGLSNKSLLLLEINSEYRTIALITPVICHFEQYPSIAGNFISRLLKKQGVDTDGIIPDEAYAVLYIDGTNEVLLVNQYRMGFSECFVTKKLNKKLV